MSFRIQFVIFLLLLSSQSLMAQRQDTPENSLLPAIDPQDIEIRSEFKARFPGLSRQPILGFNPKPRVFTISPDRMPFMESPDEAVASIIVSQMSLPAAPPKRKIEMPARNTAYVRAGLGSFITPDVEAYALHRFTPGKIISGNVNFNASDGHLSNQASGYRNLNANIIYSNQINDRIRMAVKGEVHSDFNHLPKLAESVPNNGKGAAKTNYEGVNLGFLLSGNKNALNGWNFYLNAGHNSFDFTTPTNQYVKSLIENIGAPNISIIIQENLLDIFVNELAAKTGFEKKWTGKNLNQSYGFKVNAEGSIYDTFKDDKAWLNTNATLQYNKLINYSLDLHLEAGVSYTDDAFDSNVYFTTNSKADLSILDNLSVNAQVFAQPHIKTLTEHHNINPYLSVGNYLQTEYNAGLKAGIDFIPFAASKIFGNISFENINNKAFYEREVANINANQELLYYKVKYEDANILTIKGGITHQLVPRKLWFDGLFYLRNPRLASKKDIPFEEKIGAEAAISYKPINNLKLHTWAQFIGEKKTGQNNPTQTVESAILLNADLELSITPNFGVYAKMLNMFNNKYEIWEGYEERPLQIIGGIKIKF